MFGRAKVVSVMVLCMSFAMTSVRADWYAGRYWADGVSEWAGSVQNYNGILMAWTTAWWLLGPPDADVDGNGYVWDGGDQDTVAGWRSSGSASILFEFERPIEDGPGADASIFFYGGGKARADVFASSNGVNFEVIGTLAGGSPGWLQEAELDWSGLVDSVRFLRLNRAATGSGSGMFFDAVGETARPPSIQAAVSHKTHGSTGKFAIDVTESGAVEPRAGGPTEIEIIFDRAIQIGALSEYPDALSSVSVSRGQVLDVVSEGSQILVVTLEGVEDAGFLTISFPGIANAADALQTVTDELTLGVLCGDASGDGVVNVFDMLTARLYLNQTAGPENAMADINLDGDINIFDLLTIRIMLNASLGPQP